MSFVAIANRECHILQTLKIYLASVVATGEDIEGTFHILAKCNLAVLFQVVHSKSLESGGIFTGKAQFGGVLQA